MPDGTEGISYLPYRVKVDGSTVAAFDSHTQAGLYAASKLVSLTTDQGPVEVALEWNMGQI